MNNRRLELSEELHNLLKENEYPDNVYFQPPSTSQMSYPCIRYSYDGMHTLPADNMKYIKKDRYTLIVIDPNPDCQIPDILLEHFKLISFNRSYPADNLNHFVLTLYF